MSQEPLVLVVEDDRAAREFCCECLAASGFRVAFAASGLEAVAAAAELRPDLVLMDLALPGIDGGEATRRIKADVRTAEIPVVALTAYTLSDAAERARKAGYAKIVVKPYAPEALVADLRDILRKSGRIEAPEASPLDTP